MGPDPDMLPLRCVALDFIWHLAVAAVWDAVEVLKMALTVLLLFAVTGMCVRLVFGGRGGGQRLENENAAHFWQLSGRDIVLLRACLSFT